MFEAILFFFSPDSKGWDVLTHHLFQSEWIILVSLYKTVCVHIFYYVILLTSKKKNRFASVQFSHVVLNDRIITWL